MSKINGETSKPFLQCVEVLSLVLGICGLLLSVVLGILYVYSSAYLLSVLCGMSAVYGIVRLVCAFKANVPSYVKMLVAYVGTTLWLTLGITITTLGITLSTAMWAALSVPILCDLLLTTVSCLDKAKPEEPHA